MVLILFVATACQEKVSSTETSEAQETEEDKVLTIVYSSPLDDPDPQGISNAPRRAVDTNVFNRLFRLDWNLEIQPEIVESYEMTDDIKYKVNRGYHIS